MSKGRHDAKKTRMELHINADKIKNQIRASMHYLIYVNEFEFRHNNRKNPDIIGSAIAGC